VEKISVDIAIIGSGSAGLYALSQVRDSGKSFVLINSGPTGTTCARVGCMPSKALIQVAEEYHQRNILKRYGIEGLKEIPIDREAVMDHVRDLRDTFVERVRSNSTDKMPPDRFIQGYARFLDPHTLEVEGREIHAQRFIIATGLHPDPSRRLGTLPRPHHHHRHPLRAGATAQLPRRHRTRRHRPRDWPGTLPPRNRSHRLRSTGEHRRHQRPGGRQERGGDP